MVGDRIRWLRNLARLSQADLAEQVGMSEIQILRWENGKADPGAEAVRKMAKIFGVTSDYILGLSDDPHGYIDTELTAREWAIIRALRESSWTSFMMLLTEDLKERE